MSEQRGVESGILVGQFRVHLRDARRPVRIAVEMASSDLGIESEQGRRHAFRDRRRPRSAQACQYDQVMNVLHRIGVGRQTRGDPVEQSGIVILDHRQGARQLAVEVRVSRWESRTQSGSRFH